MYCSLPIVVTKMLPAFNGKYIANHRICLFHFQIFPTSTNPLIQTSRRRCSFSHFDGWTSIFAKNRKFEGPMLRPPCLESSQSIRISEMGVGTGVLGPRFPSARRSLAPCPAPLHRPGGEIRELRELRVPCGCVDVYGGHDGRQHRGNQSEMGWLMRIFSVGIFFWGTVQKWVIYGFVWPKKLGNIQFPMVTYMFIASFSAFFCRQVLGYAAIFGQTIGPGVVVMNYICHMQSPN